MQVVREPDMPKRKPFPFSCSSSCSVNCRLRILFNLICHSRGLPLRALDSSSLTPVLESFKKGETDIACSLRYVEDAEVHALMPRWFCAYEPRLKWNSKAKSSLCSLNPRQPNHVFQPSRQKNQIIRTIRHVPALKTLVSKFYFAFMLV